MMARGGGTPGPGSPWWGDISQSDHNVETFHYDHPLTPLVLLVSKTLEVQCPGCGDMKRMLVRHIKTDQACRDRCSSIDMDNFDRQLKRFRHRRQMKESKQRKKEESEAVFSHMTEYKKMRREESKSQEERNYHYGNKHGRSAKDYMEMLAFQNEFSSKSYSERKEKDLNCERENKIKRECLDGFKSPPSKQKKEELKGKNSEEVHILTIGEFDKKEEQRIPTESEYAVSKSREDSEKETDSNSEVTSNSGFSGSSERTAGPPVQNTLNPAQMVEAMKYLLETDDNFVHRLHEAYLKTVQKR